MFYVEWLLTSKTAPLGKIWLAAHWEKKLTKQEISGINISEKVEEIISPELPMSLRLSSHLLLGIARIFSKKVKYLLADCKDAMIKIKVTYTQKEIQIDLPGDRTRLATITLPEPQIHEAMPEFALDEQMGLDFRNFTEINVHQGHFEFGAEPLEFEPFGGIPLSQEIPEERDILGRPEYPLGPLEISEPIEGEFGGVGFEGEGPPELELSLDQTLLAEWDQPGPLLPDILPSPSESESSTTSAISLLIAQPRRIKRVKIDKRTLIQTAIYKDRTDNATDLVREISLAPKSRKEVLQEEREKRNASDILNNALLPDLPDPLASLFQRNMISKPTTEEGLIFEEEISPERAREEISRRESFGAEFEEFGGAGFEPFEELGYIPEYEALSDIDVESIKEPVQMTETTKNVLNNLLTARDPETHLVSFFDKVQDQPRARGAKYFVELLNLRTRGYINLEQASPYSDISITVYDPEQL